MIDNWILGTEEAFLGLFHGGLFLHHVHPVQVLFSSTSRCPHDVIPSHTPSFSIFPILNAFALKPSDLVLACHVEGKLCIWGGGSTGKHHLWAFPGSLPHPLLCPI